MSISAENKRILEDRRKTEIMAAAKKLFFTCGFDGTSIEQIAQATGISKGLVYHYFKSKEKLLLSFYSEIESYLENLKKMENPLEALRKFGEDFLVNDVEKYSGAPLLQVFLISFAEHKFDISKYESANPILKDFGREYLATFFERGIEGGIFRKGDAKSYGDIYWSFLLGKLLPVKKGHESLGAKTCIKKLLYVGVLEFATVDKAAFANLPQRVVAVRMQNNSAKASTSRFCKTTCQ